MVAVWAVAAPEDAAATLEAIWAARSLAAAVGGQVGVLALDAPPGAETAFGEAGADRLVNLSPAAPVERTDWAAAALAEAISQFSEAVLAMVWPCGPWGREVGSRVAVRMGVGFVSGVSRAELSIAQGSPRLTAERPIYGGKAVATVVPNGKFGMVQWRPRSVDAPAESGHGPAEREDRSAPPIPEGGVTRIARREASTEGPRLTEARRIVSGGRGLGGPEPFGKLHELADLIGGAVGASRAAVDAGWVPPSYQIGQTGVSVAPDLYLAVGISGASQHTAGITRARHVVVVNRDAEAPLFAMAELGVVGDFREVVPALIEALREIR